jgi:hypothetical protein
MGEALTFELGIRLNTLTLVPHREAKLNELEKKAQANKPPSKNLNPLQQSTFNSFLAFLRKPIAFFPHKIPSAAVKPCKGLRMQSRSDWKSLLWKAFTRFDGCGK